MSKCIGISLVIFMFVIIGCSTPERRESTTKTKHKTTISAPTVASAKANAKTYEVKITKQEYCSSWPFTVNEGVLTCKDSGITVGTTEMKEVLFTTNEVTYALNGYAKGLKKYADVRKIWADDPTMPGLKKNIGPIIERALNFPEEPVSKTSAKTPQPMPKTSGAPPPELDSKVQVYNKLLQQAQQLLTKRLGAEQEHMRAIDEWEAAHGELDSDKPYPRQLTKLADVSNSYLEKQEQSMRKAAAILQGIKASSAFIKYYKEDELAIDYDEVPGRLKDTPAEDLRFIHRL